VVRLSGGSPALPGGAADMLVVGVAGDIAWESLNESPRLMVYVPYAQFYSSLVTFIASVSGDADLTAVAMRTAATDMDPELSVLDATTMARHVSTQLRPTQVVAGMLSGFAILVLLLAAIGLYGIVSYAVATRTREVGIRMALGADSSAVRRLLTMSGARLVAIGVAIGLLLAFPVNGLLSNMLFGVESVEPAAFAGASLVLGAIALLAAYLPARRASKVNPVVALRTE
jgi:putative ABC transport system permease protein